jgi:hypothetical protein
MPLACFGDMLVGTLHVRFGCAAATAKHEISPLTKRDVDRKVWYKLVKNST